MTSNQVNIVQMLLRKLANWLASLEELLSLNVKKLSLHYIMHLYALIYNFVLNSGHHTPQHIIWVASIHYTRPDQLTH